MEDVGTSGTEGYRKILSRLIPGLAGVQELQNFGDPADLDKSPKLKRSSVRGALQWGNSPRGGIVLQLLHSVSSKIIRSGYGNHG
jgi:hypothetical protein